jgi:DEAD/DEAH box helicase domain-containing protein
MKKIVFDIETRNIFQDVGRNDPSLLDISVVGLYDYETNSYHAFLQEEFPKMWPFFEKADMLIGFNSDHFDIPLLDKYYPGDLTRIKSLDLLAEVRKSLGRRIGLDALASATLGVGKTSHGLQAVEWWKEGKIDEIKEYCIADVEVTKDLYEFALKNGHVRYKDGVALQAIRLDTGDWEKEKDAGMTFSLGF